MTTPTPTELVEAAERYVKLVEEMDDNAKACPEVNDGHMLAMHTLRTVHKDDELDVTEDWFRSVSNLVNIHGPTIHHQGRYLTWFTWGLSYYDEDTDAVSTCIKKRWQLRAFCAATGMPLREV